MVNPYIPEQKPDNNLLQQYFDYAPVGTLDVLGATLEETLYYNPLTAVDRFFEQTTGAGRRGKMLSQDEWRGSEYFRDGIEVGKEGIREGLAKLLAERKDERDAFKLTLSRSPGGIALGASQFGVAFAGSMLDPLNIASAFIPGVGQARLGVQAAKLYGKNGGRFLVGAMDGAIGATAVEPLIIGQAYLEQDHDYGLMDSFLNVTIGSAMGGGLHLGFGKISDMISKASQEARDTAAATAVAQAANDQNVNVSAILDDTRRREATELVERAKEARDNDPQVRAVEREIDPETGEVKSESVIRDDAPDVATWGNRQEAYKRKGKKTQLPKILRATMPKSLVQFIRANGGILTSDPLIGEIDEIFDNASLNIKNTSAADRTVKAGKTGTRVIKGGKTLDQWIVALREAGYIQDVDPDAPDTFGVNDLLTLIRDDLHGERRFSDADANAVADAVRADDLLAIAGRYGIDPTGMDDDTFLRAINDALEKEEYFSRSTAQRQSGMTEQEFYDAMDEARTQQLLDDEDLPAGVLSDYAEYLDELDAAGTDIEVATLQRVNEEIELLEQDVARLREQGLSDPTFDGEISQINDFIEKADTVYDDISRAAAMCVIQRR